ncbi:MAG TPA: peptidoglycan endopeptidase [Geobacteraceae bacterium]
MKLFATLLVHVLFLVAATASSAVSPAPRYAVAVLPTPVLNSADFAGVFGGGDGRTLRRDPCGLMREVEFVALPGTVFRVEETLKHHGVDVYRVTTDDYPYPAATGYFIDSRFVTLAETPPPPRPRRLPSRQELIDRLLAAQGSRYVWGGNQRAGIPQLLAFYPPAPGRPLSQTLSDLWQLRGVDCSGLLYEATGGFTPRNTSALVAYGEAVPIRGLDAGEIARRVEPLDLIVWPGHVMIVIDNGRIIESRLDCSGKKGGVMIRPLGGALGELVRSRVPLNDLSGRICIGVRGFVIRRWYPVGK